MIGGSFALPLQIEKKQMMRTTNRMMFSTPTRIGTMTVQNSSAVTIIDRQLITVNLSA